MPTSLTKEILLEKTKCRYEEVEIDGWGTIGIRSVSPVKRSHRMSKMFDDNGNIKQEEVDKRDVLRLIDQLMVDENTPMFSEADFDTLVETDAARWDPINEAIRVFNGEEPEKNDSGDTSKNSDETTD